MDTSDLIAERLEIALTWVPPVYRAPALDDVRVFAARLAAAEADVAFAYTVGSGRLFMEMADFHARAEKLLGRPILTHEFAGSAIWAELREAVEKRCRAALAAGGGGDNE